MRVAIDAVREAGALCEGAICYTGDLFDPARPSTASRYYVGMATRTAARRRARARDQGHGRRVPAARRGRTGQGAEGRDGAADPLPHPRHERRVGRVACWRPSTPACDAVDGALDAMSGLTSQPNLSSIAAALAGTERDPGLDQHSLHEASSYWEGVRRFYAPFESDIRAGTADVYRHEMPGGQYTNLREQARALGLEQRWTEVVAGLRGGESPVRRHRQGDADLQGGRRHGALHGRQRTVGRRCARPAARHGVSRVGGVDAAGRTRLPARRLSARAVAPGAEGRAAPAVSARAIALRRSTSTARGQRRKANAAASSTTGSSPRT